MTRTKVLVTGGAGFIGSRLCARLAETFDVTAYDNFHPQAHDGNPENRQRLLNHGIKVVTGDVCDPAAMQKAIAAVDPSIVYHLAAETGTGQSFDLPARYCDVNIMGTAHLIEAIRATGPNVSRVVLAASRSVYGEGSCVDAAGVPALAVERHETDLARGDFTPKDKAGAALVPVATNSDCPVAPASVYASSKLMQEYLLQQAFWGTDVRVGILRLQNVYGPGQSLNNPYTGVLSIFARQIQEEQTLNIYEDGEITRDFVLVDDVVDAFVRMATIAEMPQEILDIGSGEGATILDISKSMLAMLGRPGDRYKISGMFRPGDIRHAVADIRRANDRLGWAPSVTLNEGLMRLVDWSRTMRA